MLAALMYLLSEIMIPSFKLNIKKCIIYLCILQALYCIAFNKNASF